MNPNATPIPFLSSTEEQQSIPNSSILQEIIRPAFVLVVFLLGFIGNSLIVYIIQAKFRSKRICDVFLMHLAVADLLLLCILPFWAIESILKMRWIFGDALCKITSWFSIFSSYGSVFFLSIISLDRMAVVVLDQKFREHRTKIRAYVAIILAWTLAVSLSLPSLHFRKAAPVKENRTDFLICRWNFDNTSTSDTIWYGMNFGLRFVIGFVVPLCIIFTCYLTINAYLSRKKSQKKLLRKKQDRITVTIWIMIFVFILCWLPNQVSGFIFMAEGIDLIKTRSTSVRIFHGQVHIFLTTLSWSHSCMNPILYAFMRDDVRGKLAEILHRLVTTCCCKGSAKYTKSTCTDGHLQAPCNKLGNGESLRCTSPTRITLLKRSILRTSGKKAAVEASENIFEEEMQEVQHHTSVI